MNDKNTCHTSAELKIISTLYMAVCYLPSTSTLNLTYLVWASPQASDSVYFTKSKEWLEIGELFPKYKIANHKGLIECRANTI